MLLHVSSQTPPGLLFITYLQPMGIFAAFSLKCILHVFRAEKTLVVGCSVGIDPRES